MERKLKRPSQSRESTDDNNDKNNPNSPQPGPSKKSKPEEVPEQYPKYLEYEEPGKLTVYKRIPAKKRRSSDYDESDSDTSFDIELACRTLIERREYEEYPKFLEYPDGLGSAAMYKKLPKNRRRSTDDEEDSFSPYIPYRSVRRHRVTCKPCDINELSYTRRSGVSTRPNVTRRSTVTRTASVESRDSDCQIISDNIGTSTKPKIIWKKAKCCNHNTNNNPRPGTSRETVTRTISTDSRDSDCQIISENIGTYTKPKIIWIKTKSCNHNTNNNPRPGTSRETVTRRISIESRDSDCQILLDNPISPTNSTRTPEKFLEDHTYYAALNEPQPDAREDIVPRIVEATSPNSDFDQYPVHSKPARIFARSSGARRFSRRFIRDSLSPTNLRPDTSTRSESLADSRPVTRSRRTTETRRFSEDNTDSSSSRDSRPNSRRGRGTRRSSIRNTGRGTSKERGRSTSRSRGSRDRGSSRSRGTSRNSGTNRCRSTMEDSETSRNRGIRIIRTTERCRNSCRNSGTNRCVSTREDSETSRHRGIRIIRGTERCRNSSRNSGTNRYISTREDSETSRNRGIRIIRATERCRNRDTGRNRVTGRTRGTRRVRGTMRDCSSNIYRKYPWLRRLFDNNSDSPLPNNSRLEYNRERVAREDSYTSRNNDNVESANITRRIPDVDRFLDDNAVYFSPSNTQPGTSRDSFRRNSFSSQTSEYSNGSGSTSVFKYSRDPEIRKSYYNSKINISSNHPRVDVTRVGKSLEHFGVLEVGTVTPRNTIISLDDDQGHYPPKSPRPSISRVVDDRANLSPCVTMEPEMEETVERTIKMQLSTVPLFAQQLESLNMDFSQFKMVQESRADGQDEPQERDKSQKFETNKQDSPQEFEANEQYKPEEQQRIQINGNDTPLLIPITGQNNDISESADQIIPTSFLCDKETEQDGPAKENNRNRYRQQDSDSEDDAETIVPDSEESQELSNFRRFQFLELNDSGSECVSELNMQDISLLENGNQKEESSLESDLSFEIDYNSVIQLICEPNGHQVLEPDNINQIEREIFGATHSPIFEEPLQLYIPQKSPRNSNNTAEESSEEELSENNSSTLKKPNQQEPDDDNQINVEIYECLIIFPLGQQSSGRVDESQVEQENIELIQAIANERGAVMEKLRLSVRQDDSDSDERNQMEPEISESEKSDHSSKKSEKSDNSSKLSKRSDDSNKKLEENDDSRIKSEKNYDSSTSEKSEQFNKNLEKRDHSSSESNDGDHANRSLENSDHSSKKTKEIDHSRKKSNKSDDTSKKSEQTDYSSKKSIKSDYFSKRSKESDPTSKRSEKSDHFSKKSVKSDHFSKNPMKSDHSSKRSEKTDSSSNKSKENDHFSQSSVQSSHSSKNSEKSYNSSKNSKSNDSRKISEETDSSNRISVNHSIEKIFDSCRYSSERDSERDYNSSEEEPRSDESVRATFGDSSD